MKGSYWHRMAHFHFLNVPHFTSVYFGVMLQKPAKTLGFRSNEG